jgi:hypothetical protein
MASIDVRALVLLSKFGGAPYVAFFVGMFIAFRAMRKSTKSSPIA